MLLGDFNSIYIGDTSIDAVYIGSDLVWSSNPSPYTQLTYIQSTNCQTINTGYIPNENSRIEAEFMLYTSVHNEYGQALFGNGGWKLFYNRNRTLQTEYQFGSGNITTTASVLPYHKQFKLVCDKNGATWYDTEDVQIGNVSVTGTTPGTSPLYIGSDSNSYYSEYRIYSFKIYEGDTLVMNLTPVQRNEDGVCGLLDTVSGNFFVDVGTQQAGYYSDRFEDSYTQLEAVETSGNLYVDTDYIPDTPTRITIDSVPKTAGSSDGEILLGCTNNVQSGTDDFVINTEYRSSPYLPYYQRGGAFVFFDSVNSMERRSTIEIYQNDVTIEYEDGTSEQYTVSGTPSSYTSPVSLYLFALHYEAGNYTSTSYARFYNCKIEEIESDIVKQIHNFIPVKRKFDNIIVLYDTISNSEYPPVGGSFKDASTMPHMDGVLCYYDCNDGIGTEGGNPAWINRVSGGSNMILHNASVAQDGAISFYGENDSGNGKFSCSTTESATMYVLFKRTGSSVIDNYIHICGSVANGEHFPYVGAPDGYWKYGIQFMLNNNAYVDTGLFQFDITGDAIRDMSISCLDYHVVCCIRQKNGAVYDNIMYVDGSLIGRIDGTPYPPGTNYGVCIGVDSFGYEDKTYDDYDTLIKMIAVGSQAHTAQQVAENSAWLLSHFTV